MSTMIREIYDALKEAGASEEKAAAAAEALAGYPRYEERFTHVENRLERVEERLTHIEGRLERVEDRLAHVENRLDRVEERLTQVEGRLERVEERLNRVEIDLAAIKAQLGIMRWLMGGTFLAVMLLVIRTFWPGV